MLLWRQALKKAGFKPICCTDHSQRQLALPILIMAQVFVFNCQCPRAACQCPRAAAVIYRLLALLWLWGVSWSALEAHSGASCESKACELGANKEDKNPQPSHCFWLSIHHSLSNKWQGQGHGRGGASVVAGQGCGCKSVHQILLHLPSMSLLGTLLVGEGNLSFAAAVGQPTDEHRRGNIVATVLQGRHGYRAEVPNNCLDECERLGVQVCFTGCN